MQITLNQMRLKNFKGVVGEKVYTFQDGLNNVYGRNRTGKTTIHDAFLWVLFDKNSEGATKFGVKPRDKQGNDLVPNQDYEVELSLMIDGMKYDVVKRLNEKRSMARGKREELAHTTSYFVNGHKMTAGDYKKWVNETVMDENLFRAITNTRYFTSLKPEVQRNVLVNMVGLTPTEQVISNDEAMSRFYASLSDNDKDMEQYRAHLKYEMDGIKKELELIPERIKEQSNNLSEYATINWDEIETELIVTEKQIADIDEQLVSINAQYKAQSEKSSEALRAKYNEINECRSQAMKIESAINAQNVARTRDNKNKIAAIEDELRQVEREYFDTQSNIERLEKDVELHNSNKAQFNEEYNDLMDKMDAHDDKMFVFDERSRYCPTCGQLLPDADIEKAHARLLAEWNKRHAEEGKKLQEHEARMNERANTLNRLTHQYKQRSEQLASQIDIVKGKRDECKKRLDEAKNVNVEFVNFAHDAQWQELNAKVQALSEETSHMNTQNIEQVDTSDLVNSKTTYVAMRDELKKQLFGRDVQRKIKERIAELEAQEDKLQDQLTSLEWKDDMAQAIINAIIEDLETRVNQLFSYVQFKMFTQHLNGNVEPTCVCTVKGQPFTDVNYADKINAGIDIINTISKHRNAYAPCFIDNAESINVVMPMQCQQICLTVSQDNEIVVNP